MKKVLIGLLALVVAGGSAFAQMEMPTWTTLEPPTPSGIAGAPSAFASGARWPQPWHSIMNPAAGPGLSFNSWMGFASFTHNDVGVPSFALAYATRIGDIYLAAYFGGNSFHGFDNRTATETWVPWGTTPGRTFRAFTLNVDDFGSSDVDNRVAIVLGFADMGIRLSYGTTMSTFNESDAILMLQGVDEFGDPASDTFITREVSHEFGMRQVELVWAMARTLLPGGIRPEVHLRLNFARNFLEMEFVDPGQGTSEGNFVFYSLNYFQPEIAIESGNFNFLTTDGGWTFGGDLMYQISFRTFNNDYSFEDVTGRDRTSSVDGFYMGGGVVRDNMSWVQHVIRPRLYLNRVQGNLSLSTRLGLSTTLRSEGHDERTILDDYTGRIGRYGTDVSSFTVIFAPNLELGMRFHAIPNRLTIFGGGVLNPGSITRTSEDRTARTPVAADNRTLTTTRIAFGPTSSQLRAGLTFHFTPNFALDAVSAVSNGANVNVFGDGGNSLTNFTRIMAAFTF